MVRTRCYVTFLEVDGNDNHVVDCRMAPSAIDASAAARLEAMQQGAHEDVEILAVYEGYLTQLPLAERDTMDRAMGMTRAPKIGYRLSPGCVD